MVGLLIQGRRGCLVAQLKFGVHTHVQCPHKGTQKLNAGFPVEWGGVGHRRCAGAIQMFQATGHFDVRFGFVAARHHQIGLYGHAQAHQKVIEGHPNDGVLGAQLHKQAHPAWIGFAQTLHFRVQVKGFLTGTAPLIKGNGCIHHGHAAIVRHSGKGVWCFFYAVGALLLQ